MSSIYPSHIFSNSDNNIQSNIYSSDIKIRNNKYTSSKSKVFADSSISCPSDSQKKTACRIVEKETSSSQHLLGDVCDYGNLNAGSNKSLRRSISRCISNTNQSSSEVYPENNPRCSSIIERVQVQQDGVNAVTDSGAEELLHQLNRDTPKAEQNSRKVNCTIDNNISNNISSNNLHRDRNADDNPAPSGTCDIPRFILVPHTSESSLCTNTSTTQQSSKLTAPHPDLEFNSKTLVTVTPLEDIEVEFSSSPRGRYSTHDVTGPVPVPVPALPPAGPPLKKSFSQNTGTTETNTHTTPAELRYSGSFNSKSTHFSYRDQDYSEEKRLLLLAATNDSTNNSNNIGINLDSIRSSSSRSNTPHRRSKSHPLSNIHINNPSIGICRSISNNTNITSNNTDPTKKYTHRRSNSLSKESPLRSYPPSTAPMTLTPHSNLADLISASKKIQQSQAAAVAAAGGGPGSGMGGRNRRGANGGNNNNNPNDSTKASSPRSRPALTRPSSISSKSKSTGMYFSPKEQKQHSSTSTGNDLSFSSSAAILYSSSPSAMPNKAHVSRHSYSHAQQTRIYNHGKQGVQLVPQQNRPGIVKQSSTTGTIGNSAVNPFEDPSLIGDLHQSNSTHGGTFINNSNHPLQNHIIGNNCNSGNVVQFDPLKITSSASSTSSTQQYPQQQQHHQPSPSIDTAQLSELAAALSTLKPQQTHNIECNINNMNPEQLKLSDHQVTLGHAPKESTGTAKSHRRFLSLRGSKSMNVDDMKGIMDSIQQQQSGSESFDYGGVSGTGSGSSDQYDISSNGSKDKKEKKHKRAASMGIFKRNDTSVNDVAGGERRPITPVKALRRGRNNVSPNSSNGEEEDGIGRAAKSPGRRKRGIRLGGGKNQSTRNTNSENNNGGTPHHSPRRMSNQPLETIQSNESTGSYPVAQCSSSGGSPTAQIKLRSSEQDPSPHQIRIPSVSDVLLQAKLCHLMEKYREIDQNFDFGVLTNISRAEMEMFVDLDKKSQPTSPVASAATSGGNNLSPSKENTIMQNTALTSPSPMTTSRLNNLVDAHKPILESIISSASDLVLAAFYYEINQNENTITHDTTQDRSPGDRTEVAIFASDVLRQFIVVYQGSAENQAKPIRKRFTGKFKSNVTKNFRSDEENLTVFPPFEQGYSQSGIEDKVFQKLDALAEQHPFFDVIVTGHSYGGMMALLGSMRYACSRPAMMVSCFAFGCPKVGALDFRHYVNSLPNLNVTRFEYGFDPWVHAPDNPTWTHAGHTLSILQQVQSNKERKGGNDKGNKDNSPSQSELLIRAYKFGNDRPDSAANGKFIGKKGNRQEKQIDHDIASYLNAVELIAKEAVSWPRQFVGEEGTGVRGLNKEKRLVC